MTYKDFIDSDIVVEINIQGDYEIVKCNLENSSSNSNLLFRVKNIRF